MRSQPWNPGAELQDVGSVERGVVAHGGRDRHSVRFCRLGVLRLGLMDHIGILRVNTARFVWIPSQNVIMSMNSTWIGEPSPSRAGRMANGGYVA